MATQKFGPFGPFSGKLGKVIGYVDKNGKQHLRYANKHVFNNPSDALLGTWQATRITVAFLAPVIEFVRMGFAVKAASMRMSGYNLATSFTKGAIKGAYPHLQIDFSKIFFSAGDMPIAKNPEVIVVEHGLMFSWDTGKLETGTKKSDQVMLMAYLPDSGKAYYLRSGAGRKQGWEYLELPFKPRGQKVETYLSFNSEDHKSISNSVYTGQVIYDQ